MSRILNNTKALVFIIAILLAANIAILVFFLAIKHPPKKDDRNKDNRPSISEFLKNDVKFSPRQIKQYDSLKKYHGRIVRPLYRGMNAAKDSFYIHLSDDVVSDQLLSDASDTIAKQQKEMDLQMFDHFRNIRGLCTPAQRPIYDSLVQDIIKKIMNPYRKDSRPKKPAPDKRPDSVSNNR